jgi:hypothetical protein
MSELVKAATQQLDGFDSFEDAIEGEEERGGSGGGGGGGLLQGCARIKFTNQAEWVLASDNTKLPPDLELLVWDILRVVQKWPVEPGPPLEERVLQPGEKIPDLNKQNAEAPQSEWRMGPNGQMQGPYQFQFIVYLFHEATAARYAWASGTIGAKVCLRDLTERLRFMRQYRGAKVHAVVKLTNTFMPTRFGGRQRPAFEYVRWVPIGGEPAALAATEAAQPKAVAHTPEQTVKPAEPQPAAQTVTKPTAKEVTGDEIVF